MKDDPTLETEEEQMRMYFMPAGVRYDELPMEVRIALLDIVLPCYRELVICAGGALARSAGVSLTYLLTLEVLEQFELTRELDFLQQPPEIRTVAKRQKQITRYLKLVGRKQDVLNFLLRLKTARHKIDPLASE